MITGNNHSNLDLDQNVGSCWSERDIDQFGSCWSERDIEQFLEIKLQRLFAFFQHPDSYLASKYIMIKFKFFCNRTYHGNLHVVFLVLQFSFICALYGQCFLHCSISGLYIFI